ncbi:hypothetical protein CEXT_73121 [Caerostris extrusa]|uniref:Uncharacterized protein n=1 Tax=Caerostris extrusa TaxID=172846 RepID=A0AAV4Y5N2_CAEEX|nr:hypothetical protein CEXT_73121 [Caerostris extrusa]
MSQKSSSAQCHPLTPVTTPRTDAIAPAYVPLNFPFPTWRIHTTPDSEQKLCLMILIRKKKKKKKKRKERRKIKKKKEEKKKQREREDEMQDSNTCT